MLFNSYIFIFVFLPVTLAAVALARRAGVRPAMAVLVAASLLFYGWFVPGHIALLLGSVAVNYGIGRLLHRRGGSRAWLTAGVAANLGLLGTFKYLDFLIGTVNGALGAEWTLLHIILPLAISFFTFQQIAYLVDVHRGLATPPPPLDYALFVCFFPQLIAGPIVHHSEIVPQ
ncbi:MAG: MBOAT family protein, partial [Pseudomonadota bacterium]